MIEFEKLKAKALELKEWAEAVRIQAETIRDDDLRMQMHKLAASYERMAAELMETAMRRRR